MNHQSETESRQIDIEMFLDPARSFHHPRQVLSDIDLTSAEKLSILVIWAKQISAASAIPELYFKSDNRIPFDDVVEAIDELHDHSDRLGVAASSFQAQLIENHSTGSGRRVSRQRPRSIPILIGGKIVS